MQVVAQLRQLNELSLGFTIEGESYGDDMAARLFSVTHSLTTIQIQERKWDRGDAQGVDCTPFWDNTVWCEVGRT